MAKNINREVLIKKCSNIFGNSHKKMNFLKQFPLSFRRKLKCLKFFRLKITFLFMLVFKKIVK